MKYLEELENGDIFTLNNFYYLVSADFKKDGSRLCIGVQEGHSTWMKADSIVEITQLYTLDIENNITPLKTTKKTHDI
jgi:hypothetical protein